MTSSSSITQPTRVSMMMLKVLLALIPAIIATVFFFGYGVLIQLTLASLTALIVEAGILKLRRYPLKPFLLDGSALLTAWLLALSIPPTSPWWMIVLATTLAMVIGKHIFGGLGNNIFNPAMVGFAILIVAYPAQMSAWIAPTSVMKVAVPNFMTQAQMIFQHNLPTAAFDAIASATPLDAFKTAMRYSDFDVQMTWAFTDIFSGFNINHGLGLAGVGTEWVALAYLIGGIFLLQQKVIAWQIPVAVLVGIAVTAGLFASIGGVSHYPNPLFHLFAGASMIGAFFIATDPVTGPTTHYGRLIFGLLIGLITYLIRTFGNYPDGVAFAVLLLNLCTPLIDRYTQPKVFGHKTT